MIILDTNVVSETMRPVMSDSVVYWFSRVVADEIWTTAMTVAELWSGIEVLEEGRRRQSLAEQVGAMLLADYAGKVLDFTAAAAREYGIVVAETRRRGRPIATFDAQIAAIARVHGATLATRNVRRFQDCEIELVDPWTA